MSRILTINNQADRILRLHLPEKPTEYGMLENIIIRDLEVKKSSIRLTQAELRTALQLWEQEQ